MSITITLGVLHRVVSKLEGAVQLSLLLLDNESTREVKAAYKAVQVQCIGSEEYHNASKVKRAI